MGKSETVNFLLQHGADKSKRSGAFPQHPEGCQPLGLARRTLEFLRSLKRADSAPLEAGLLETIRILEQP